MKEYSDEDLMEERYTVEDRDNEDRDRREDESRCQFPGRCCMPGPHFSHECHTVQMLQEFNYHMMRGGR